MKKLFFLFTICIAVAVSAEVIFTEGFENGFKQWDKVTTLTKRKLTDRAFSGKKAALLDFTPVKNSKVRGNHALRSIKIPARAGVYRISAKMLMIENYGSSVGVEFFDSKHRKLSNGGIYMGSAPPNINEWQKCSEYAYAYDENTAYARVNVWLPWRIASVVAVDDIVLERVEDFKAAPPWKPQYKIRPHEKEKLTAADFPGPDGIVYPDFTRAGVRKGFFDQPGTKVLRLSDFGVKANDGKDCYDALTRAVKALPAAGGVIQFDEGKYTLGKFFQIERSNVVLRGAGRDKTKIDFVYDTGRDFIDIYMVSDGMHLAPRQNLQIIARARDLNSITAKLDGKIIGKYTKQLHSGNKSYFHVQLPRSAKQGKHILSVTANYGDGKVYAKKLSIVIDKKAKPIFPNGYPRGAISIKGRGFTGKDYLLAGDGLRGNDFVILKNAKHPFKKGDVVLLRAPETPRRRAITRNACNWGNFRSSIFFVIGTDGAKVFLNQPLRIDYDAVDKAFLRKIDTIHGCGVENLTIETKNDYWFTTIDMQFVTDCRVKGVNIIMAGRNPVYANNSKFCSILDSEFNDAFFKGGGGTAYIGSDSCYDFLLDGIVTRGMRHAPVVQWSANGNVIRNGVFYNSDAQWHAGWSNENLFENCHIISDTKENGGYGNVLWASPPEDGSHGPNGPRNVVYNCDGFGIEDAIYLGGMNENWIFVGNRMRTVRKAGFFVKNASFDHIIKNNVFIFDSPSSPFIRFASPDCIGIEITDNKIYGGSGKLSAGLQKPFINKNNRFYKYDKSAPRPKLAVPSIYEWQLKNKRAVK